jgi:hypothetical protein
MTQSEKAENASDWKWFNWSFAVCDPRIAMTDRCKEVLIPL